MLAAVVSVICNSEVCAAVAAKLIAALDDPSEVEPKFVRHTS
jgi:hypothetical protein